MPPFVIGMLRSTISLLTMVGLGVAGLIDNVQVMQNGLMASTTKFNGFAFGDIGYYNPNVPTMKEHEYGHLLSEDQLGIAYLPLAALGSLIGRIDRNRDYFGIWTEHQADVLGGVTR